MKLVILVALAAAKEPPDSIPNHDYYDDLPEGRLPDPRLPSLYLLRPQDPHQEEPHLDTSDYQDARANLESPEADRHQGPQASLLAAYDQEPETSSTASTTTAASTTVDNATIPTPDDGCPQRTETQRNDSCAEAKERPVSMSIAISIDGSKPWCHVKGNESVSEEDGAATAALWSLFPDPANIACVEKGAGPITALTWPTWQTSKKDQDALVLEIRTNLTHHVREILAASNHSDMRLTNVTVERHVRGCECESECKEPPPCDDETEGARDLLLYTQGIYCEGEPAETDLGQDEQIGPFLHLLRAALGEMEVSVCDVSDTFVPESIQEQWGLLGTSGGFHAIRFRGEDYNRTLIETKLRRHLQTFPFHFPLRLSGGVRIFALSRRSEWWWFRFEHRSRSVVGGGSRKEVRLVTLTPSRLPPPTPDRYSNRNLHDPLRLRYGGRLAREAEEREAENCTACESWWWILIASILMGGVLAFALFLLLGSLSGLL